MALKLTVRNKLRVPVKGSQVDENGKKVPFNFVLLCTRLKQSEIQESLEEKNAPVIDFIRRVTNGWEDVLDADNKPIPFNPENFDDVMEEAGLPGVCFHAYMKEVGATAKN